MKRDRVTPDVRKSPHDADVVARQVSQPRRKCGRPLPAAAERRIRLERERRIGSPAMWGYDG